MACSELYQSVQCAICQEVYSEPKQLSCGHSFCKQCLSGTQSLYSINCAVCRKATYLSVPGLEGVALLPTNYPLAHITELKLVQESSSEGSSPRCTSPVGASDTLCDQCACGVDPKEAWLCSSCDAHLYCSRCILTNHRLHTFERLFLQPKQWQAVCKEFDKIKTEWPAMKSIALQLKDACDQLRNVTDQVDMGHMGLCQLVEHTQSVIIEGDALRYQRVTPNSLLKLKQTISQLDCTISKCKSILPKSLEELLRAASDLRTSFGALAELSPAVLQQEAMQRSAHTRTTLITWPGDQKTLQVRLAGSFTDWKPSVHLMRHGTEFVTTLALASGKHQFKFIVDDHWLTHPNIEICSDGKGGFNNTITV